MYFEQANYDQCIKECEEAVDIGRENRADFKLIAKLVPFHNLVFLHSRTVYKFILNLFSDEESYRIVSSTVKMLLIRVSKISALGSLSSPASSVAQYRV